MPKKIELKTPSDFSVLMLHIFLNLLHFIQSVLLTIPFTYIVNLFLQSACAGLAGLSCLMMGTWGAMAVSLLIITLILKKYYQGHGIINGNTIILYSVLTIVIVTFVLLMVMQNGHSNIFNIFYIFLLTSVLFVFQGYYFLFSKGK